jgi:osmotically-inducible protein OsmY
VKSVTNEIELRPTVSAMGVKIKIEDVLKRDAVIEAKNITVETSGNTATLTGCVHSWAEDAEYAALAAPGVSSVSNLLTASVTKSLTPPPSSPAAGNKTQVGEARR